MAGDYSPKDLRTKWQAYWETHTTFRTPNPGDAGFDPAKPKFYVLDMFPYPSGSGLHVGHPEGYTATDIIARYKRMRGFNVLHPMGWDAFGLPAEQHAVETGTHPAVTTLKNIATFRRQLKMLGFSYDWDRELSTTDEPYYRWTQWIFLKLFNSWYDDAAERARPIAELPIPADVRSRGEKAVRAYVDAQRLAYLAEVPVNWCPALGTVLSNEEVTNDGKSERGNHPVFRRPMRQWMLRITKYADRLERDLEHLAWPESVKLMQRNWIGRSEGATVRFGIVGEAGKDSGEGGCEKGFSHQQGIAEERRKPKAESRNGGVQEESQGEALEIFTTRPDTLFGATYMVLAPEHPLVAKFTTLDQRAAVSAYCEQAKNRSDMDRTAESMKKTGVFTGGHAINPVNDEKIPIWVADYVLMGYGTGAIMAVPAHDERDFEFAKQFDLSLRAVVRPPDAWLHKQIVTRGLDRAFAERRGRLREMEVLVNSESLAALTTAAITFLNARAILDGDVSWMRQVGQPTYAAEPGLFLDCYIEDGEAINSGSFDGLPTSEFKKRIVAWLEERGLGRGTVNYKLRDWLFSRQRYWGEPFPILHGPDGEIVALDESELPLRLPEIDDFRPQVAGGETASHGGNASSSPDQDVVPEPPLGRAKQWATVQRAGKTYKRELNTMPQWAGSCWYYLRFLDPKNDTRLCGKDAEAYWMLSKKKDGTPHVGGIDLYLGGAEHAVLHLLYARFWHKVLFDLGCVSTIEPFGKLFNQGMIRAFAYTDARGAYIGYDDIDFREDGAHHRATGEKLRGAVEKMSKSMKNVINPEEVVDEYGADSLRLYEMFMGPLDASKPWNPRDVPGVFRFLQRAWRLIVDERSGDLSAMIVTENEKAPSHRRQPGVSSVEAVDALERTLHKTIKKVTDDIERMAFNTAISAMMEFVNEAYRAKSIRRDQAERFVLLLSPFAPHLAEELWQRLRGPDWKGSLAYEPWPTHDERLVVDEQVEIPVQVNGKLVTRVLVPAGAGQDEVLRAALVEPKVCERLGGVEPAKVIYVAGRLLNFVTKA